MCAFTKTCERPVPRQSASSRAQEEPEVLRPRNNFPFGPLNVSLADLQSDLSSSVGSGSTGDYEPASGQTLGTPKTTKDEVTANLAETKNNESKVAQTFQGLKAS